MALAFDKTNFYDTGMTVSGLGLTQSCTLGFWVKRASTDVRSPIGNNPFRAGGTDSDVFTFFYVSGPWTRLQTATTTVTINSGTWGTGWTHLLTTYNGSKYRLFINGAYQAEVNATGDMKTMGLAHGILGGGEAIQKHQTLTFGDGLEILPSLPSGVPC
jgi:hypothetical protein